MSETANGENPIGREGSFKKAYAVILVIIIVASAFVGILYIDNPSDVNMVRTSFSEQTRANSTDNYTQLCLDFIQEHYPNHTVELVYSKEKITEETGIIYTIVMADIQYDEITPDAVIVSANHETGNIELGDEQIKRDYRIYVSNLPAPYPKTDWYTRKLILYQLSDLPTIDEAKDINLICKAYYLVNISDYRLLTDELNNSGYSINWTHVQDNRIQVSIDNMALSDYLRITDETYVISSFILDLSKKEINYLLILFITFPIVILGVIIYKIKKKNAHDLTLPQEVKKNDYQEYK